MQVKTQYEDSAEFTAELEQVAGLLLKLRNIVGQKRWEDWMYSTDNNFETTAFKRNARLRLELSLLAETFEDLAEELHNAG